MAADVAFTHAVDQLHEPLQYQLDPSRLLLPEMAGHEKGRQGQQRNEDPADQHDCDTGIPPKMGMVKAVGFSSCAVNSSLICSKISPPEVRATLYSPAREKGTVSKVKKMGNFDKKHWGKMP